jgi:hypothetical protein
MINFNTLKTLKRIVLARVRPGVILAKGVSGRRLHDSCADEGDRMLRNVAYRP